MPTNVVAVVDGVAVGQVSGTHVDDEQRVELISLWVAPGARGSGVTDALVTAVTDYARRAGASVLRLSVRRFNARAIELYKRTSFGPADDPGDEPTEIAMHCPLRP